MSSEQIVDRSFPPHPAENSGRKRILYLTDNPELLRQQLDGNSIVQPFYDSLLDGVSTDEIIPNRICLQYTGLGDTSDLLGKNLLTGLRGGQIKEGEIKNGGFDVLVANSSFARGSSRFHAPLALSEAGIKYIIATPERIFSENAVNAGIHVVPPESPAARMLLEGEEIDVSLLYEHLSPVSRDIMNAGSLINYLDGLEKGRYSYPYPSQNPRPMTMAEKMIARKAHTNNDEVSVDFVSPGDEVIAQPDRYYGYELQTTVGRAVLHKDLGTDFQVRRPEKAVLFNDHTALIQHTEAAQIQQNEQQLFADQHAILNIKNDPEKGAPAICHTKMLEDFALPGELILGNDSHTCTLGAVNSLAIGKGAPDLSGALAFDKMVVTVPPTIRINLQGSLRNGATMKDFMLTFGAMKELREDQLGSGKVFEFGGSALESIPFNEQLKLTNMAVELQAYTGIIEPNSQMITYLQEQRGISSEEAAEHMVQSDPEAVYHSIFTIDLSEIEPTVATPGDTQNGRPLSEIEAQNISIQKAYIGSCTHGTPEDLQQAAEVMQGHKVAEGVKLYVQASSQGNLQTAENRGYIKALLDAGAELLPIGCGACMNAGPGSTEEGEMGIFATNRNYPGRTGKGETYLANPAVVAASAIKGTICGPEALLSN